MRGLSRPKILCPAVWLSWQRCPGKACNVEEEGFVLGHWPTCYLRPTNPSGSCELAPTPIAGDLSRLLPCAAQFHTSDSIAVGPPA